MYAIGLLGSYFSQGSVAGPFQGAVDIIVVQQKDKTYKSSPWYVKCGDIQGVLTRREKIVNIFVNGAPAEFYMLLDSRGEAYFEKEVDDAVLALPSTSSSKTAEETEKFDKSGSLVSQTRKENFQEEGKLPPSCKSNIDNQNVSQQDHSNFQVAPFDPPKLDNEPCGLHGNVDAEEASKSADHVSDCSISTGAGKTGIQLAPKNVSRESEVDLEVNPVLMRMGSEGLVLADVGSIFPEQEPFDVGPGLQNVIDQVMAHPLNEVTHETASTSAMDDAVLCNPIGTEDCFSLQEPSSSESGEKNASFKSDLETSNLQATDELLRNDCKIVAAEAEGALNDSLKEDSVSCVQAGGKNLQSSSAPVSTRPLESTFRVSDASVDDGTSAAALAGENMIVRQNINEEATAIVATSQKDIVCRVDDIPSAEGSSAISVVPPSSRWTMWPLSFRNSMGEKAPVPDSAAKKQALLVATNIAIKAPLTEDTLRNNDYDSWMQKSRLRSYVPTSAQLDSLKLNDGPNKVTFLFPRVIGKAQVDANIYLWKWNTKMVISDVDGTITKSDVLGQFMPLVGRDWSQSGVTRLFSAIKENGYEVLFLSARAISQAYLTRQFLINLKQDGETLPKGPVFISPDGFIPSFYREVVRRTPHEFKISCLEGIRRLFPNDVNPFYAGFGNRDTDETSYSKVGIPKGKIFIINPKGEVMVNHHVDLKSYTSIHALVDNMFPPVYSSEQEDFNSWNYWKLPIPNIDDDELSSSAKSTKPKKGEGAKK